MPILFDSQNQLFGGGPVTTTRDFQLLRDWRGHVGEANNIEEPRDFDWSGSSHVALADLPGPYDINNAVQYVTGTDSMLTPVSDLAFSGETDIEWAAWVNLSEVPIPASDTELPFIYIYNNDTGYYLEQVFLLRADGTIALRARFFDGSTWTATHPDDMDRNNWTFFAVQFDHNTTPGGDTIYLDPGNDNVLGFNPSGSTIPSGTYDVVELLRGNGLTPDNSKRVKFSNLLGIRVPPPDGGALDVFFTIPGTTPWVVPAGVNEVTATMWAGGSGGGGGGSSSIGGRGAGCGFTKATHTTTPGETLTVVVGQGGGSGLGSGLSGEGGGGGGTSGLFRAPTPLQVSAGGGGGGGGDNSSAVAGGLGGEGGGLTGATGGTSGAALPGTGGTQFAGGFGGVGGQIGDDGDAFEGGAGADGGTGGGGTGGANNGGLLEGGDGGTNDGNGRAGGGGGGEGYYGGGGGGSSIDVNAGGGGGGGGSNYIDPGATATTNTQGIDTFPGGTGDPFYTAPVGEGGLGGGFSGPGSTGADGLVVLSYDNGAGSWREQVRSFTTQAEFDAYVVNGIFPTRYYRCSEYDLGGGFGDRYIHDISGFLNPGFAPGGVLGRNVLSGPLDTTNSYVYEDSSVATTTIKHVQLNSWALTGFMFFRQPVSVVNDGDWFFRIENDGDEFIQLERSGTTLTMRVQFSNLTQYVTSTAASPLFDGSWHRLVFSSNAVTSPGWNLGVDGVNYATVPGSVVPLSAPMTRVRWGNIDVNLALMAWANYYDTDIMTAFTSVATEADIRNYIESHTDPVVGGSDFYGAYMPMQDVKIGAT